ncbi:hypothetical protein P0033_000847 [Vibrio cholerae]|nr:hypothetical protein [Vibrio cholerae]EKF9616107.1 hypothetical protein [Vibrio cholerae]EKO6515539.1 hypothetical protein [Vibrio cholerae]ELI1913669.1 hypothetical protein [Vibrio cholerae]ELJ8673556.1 hypothetical protein [Vibrio cholerae]
MSQQVTQLNPTQQTTQSAFLATTVITAQCHAMPCHFKHTIYATYGKTRLV